MSQTPEILFHEDFPEELQPQVRRILEPHLHLARWIHTVKVYLGSDEAMEASITVMRRYHIAHLDIHPNFFGLTWSERESTLVHELFHVVVDVFSREVKWVTQTWVEPETRTYVEGRLEDAEETLVDSLAHVYLEGLKETS